MRLIEEILSKENLAEAIKRVKANKGAPGVDRMTTAKAEEYFHEHEEEMISSIMEMKYRPQQYAECTYRNQMERKDHLEYQQ